MPFIKGELLGVCGVTAEANEESKAEVEVVGRDGFRLVEFNADKLLQQSVWKKTDGGWKPEAEIKPVDGGHLVAVFPAGDEMSGLVYTFKAGVNNMFSVQDINRADTNKAEIEFKHAMCQIEFLIKNKKGDVIGLGNGNGQVSGLTMMQPSEVVYDMSDGSRKQLGTDVSLPLKADKRNYVIPGGEKYLVEAVYKNASGESEKYSKTPEFKFERNKKYVVTFILDTEGDNKQLDISVAVEEWDVEDVDCELVEEKEEEIDPKDLPVLAKVAEFNLVDVNKMADGDPKALNGSFWQFGRNVAFPYGESVESTSKKSNGNDELCWSRKYIKSMSIPDNWCTYYGSTPTWKDMVAVAKDAPKEYVGNNGGDPCPLGYHMPTRYELTYFAPGNTKDILHFSSDKDVDIKGSKETVLINGATVGVTCDYKKVDDNTVVGMRFKEVEPTAYRYTRVKNDEGKILYVEVKARKLEKAVEVAKLVPETFWSENSKKDVVRYFPACGWLNFGKIKNEYKHAYHWSADQHDRKEAWHMYFRTDYDGGSMLTEFHDSKMMGFCIRCVKND